MQPKPGRLSADYKVPGGKLLRARLEVLPGEGGPPTIAALTITGDFFMHPEEALETLEAALVGAPLEAQALRERAGTFFAGEVQVIGASAEDIVQLLLRAAGE